MPVEAYPTPQQPPQHSPPPAATLPHLIDRWRRPLAFPAWGAWLLALAAALALWLGYSQWRRLNHIQEQLAAQSANTQAQAIEARSLSQQAQTLAQDAATRASLSEARINEYTLQRSYLEQMAFELSRTRDEAMLTDIEASLRLAQQQAQLTGLADPLIAALRNAMQRVERSNQPRLTPIVTAIEGDLGRLTSSAMTDTAGLLGRIDALLLQLELLPLANAVNRSPIASGPPRDLSDHEAQALSSPDPVQASAATESAPPEAIRTDAASAQSHASAEGFTPPDSAEGGTPPADTAASTTPPPASGGSVAARLWADIADSFRGLVRVQRIESPEAALLTQEQAFFLRENMRLQLMNARMALLARQAASARADLAAVQSQLRKYFDLEAPRTLQALRTVQQLQDHIHAVEPPAITQTLTAIAAAADGRTAAASSPTGAATTIAPAPPAAGETEPATETETAEPPQEHR